MAEPNDLFPDVPQTSEPVDYGSFNSLVTASNNHSISQTEGRSLTGRIYDGMSKGVASVGVGAVVSIANSAIAITNLFGAKNEEYKTREALQYFDDDLARYYDENKAGLDIGGHVVGALVPGTAGIKVLKFAQAGVFGKNTAQLTGVFKGVQERNLFIAKQQIEQGTVFDTYNAAKYKAILGGAGDQMLQAIAFEMGVAATMQLAPAFSKESVDVMSELGTFGKNVAIAAIFGGGIGGVFEAAAVKGTTNRYLRLESKNIRPFEVTDDVGKLDIDSGTKASQMYWNMERKQKLFDTGTPLTEKEFRTLSSTLKTLEDDIRLEMQVLTNGDAVLANKLFDKLKSLPSDEFANAVTGASKIGRVVELVPEATPKHIPAWQAPLSARSGQLVYDISNTSSKGDVLIGDIVPSAADFALKGKVIRKANGDVDIGDAQTLRLVNKPTQEMTPLEASVSWTSHALAPKMDDGVVLNGQNLAQLQRALIDKPEKFTILNKGGAEIDNLQDLAIFVRQRKADLVDDLIGKDKSIDEIARILDVDKTFVENTTKGNWMLYGITDYTAPQYAVASFSKKIPDLFGIEGIANTQMRIQMARDNALAVTTKFFKEDLRFLPSMDVGTASPVDRGSSFLTSSQGFYGSILSAAEQVGRFITGKIYQKHQDNVNLLFSSERTIRNNPQLLAEFNAVVGRLRGTDQKFVFDSTGLVFGENTIVSRKYMEEVEKAFLKMAKGKNPSELDPLVTKDILGAVAKELRKPNLDEHMNLPKEVADYFRTHMQINSGRVTNYKELVNARGQTSSLSEGTLYVPAVDTTKQPYVAFVQMAEGKFGGTSERAAIVAPTAEALQGKIDLIKTKYGNQFEIYTKADTERYFKVKGEYDSQLTFNEASINSALIREGVLSDVVPRTDAYIFDEFNRWHFRQEQGLMRGMVELHYGQEFAELSALGKQYTGLVTSRSERVSARTVANPYEEVIKTATGQSRMPESKFWSKANEFAEAVGTKMFNTIQEVFTSASEGKLGWREANEAMEKYGYKAPYSDLYSLQLANTKIPTPVTQIFIQKSNAVLATAVLRLDFLDTLMNVISAPAMWGAEISHIRRMAKDPEIVGKLNELTSIAIPGVEGASMPSTTKLIGNAINNYFKHPELLAEYKAAGWIKNELDLHRELIDTVALKGTETGSQLAEIGKKAVDLGVKLTGNDWSNAFVRFVSADIMRQIGTAAKLPPAEMNAYINTFVSRVMGNMTASQRPLLFQGAIGNAIGLFQTFQFNMAQNVFRYLETGDKKAALMLLGMQNTLFGLQSNPAFHAINTHLVGNSTQGHEDIISGTYKVVGKEIGDWIMYGIGSNAISTNVYSRGDLTPRYASVVPTSIVDIPIVNATAKFAGAIWETARKVSASGFNGEIMLQGLAAMSPNRPLAGIAQSISGNVVTKNGSDNLISHSNDFFSWATLSRVAGGKPLNEAISLDAFYRTSQYKALDIERVERVGAVFKAKIRSGAMEQEDWRKLSVDYAKAGGRQETYSGWIHRQMIAADVSVVNKMRKHLSDPVVQNMQAVMGGELPDYLNQPKLDNPGNSVP